MTPTARKPLLGRAVVCLSSIDWDFIWQGHQEIMARLAQAGDQVLFIENTGVRTPRLKDLGRVLHRLRSWMKGVSGFHQERPNLVVLSPLLLPFPYAWWVRPINAWLINRAIASWVRAMRCDTPVVWTFLPTPLSLDVIDSLGPPASVYYCIDDFQASSKDARQSEASEAELFRKADLVFVTSRELQKKAMRYRKDAHLLPFAVDFDKFEARRLKGIIEPEELSAIPHPRCGYVGGVHHWIDFDLLSQTAIRNPKVNFVLVGPLQTETSSLELPNVHLLGARSHDRLPDFIGSFDMGIIPYRVCDYTASVYPTKLNEYFAMGIPVIATRLPEVLAFNEEHGGLVSIASGPEAFAAAVSYEAGHSEPGRVEARIAAARVNGWSARSEAMAALITRKVATARAIPPAWPEIERRLAMKRQWKAAAFAAAGVLLLGVLRLSPLVWWLAEPLRVPSAPVAADAVVVLAGGAGESGVAGQGHEERVAQAIALYRQGYASRLIFCSGYFRTFKEPDVMRAIALSEGIPSDAILLARHGGSTDTMLQEAAALVRRSGLKHVLLVSSPYHMRRAMLVWRKVAPDVEATPSPAARSQFYGYRETAGNPPHHGGPTFEQMGGLMREYVAILYYRLCGRL